MKSVWGALALVALAAVTATADESATSSQSGNGVTAAPDPATGLPAWRLAVDPFDRGGYGLGIYRRLNRNWDGGVQVITSINSNENDRVTTGPLYSDADTSLSASSSRENRVTLSFDARRWYAPLERVSVFLGPRLDYGYASTHREEIRYDSGENERSLNRTGDSSEQSIGAALTLGGDLRLLSNLSAQIAFQPLSFSYYWRDSDDYELYTTPFETRERASDGADQGTSFRTNLSADFFVTLYW